MRARPLHLHEPREFPILYVDDEIENLRIFELTFRREFQVLTAHNAEDAMQLINENPVAVVLSDHKMPGMTGVELLSRVREIDDKAIRILVTAYGDAETLGSAINDGRIYRYMAKPWEPEDMRLTLRQAIERYALDRERDALLQELTQLNRLSRSLHRELDPGKVVETLLHAAHQDLGFDGVSVLSFDRDHERLQWSGIAPDDEVAARLRNLELTRERTSGFFESLEDGASQSLRAEQLSELDPATREWVAEVGADEIVAVPLVGANEVVGALAIDNRRGGRRFGADDRTLLDGLSTQAVIALENARTVAALRSSRAQVERADRLGILGGLAAGLAHEINNPLVSIHTFLNLAPEKRAEDDDHFWGEYHQLATGEVERIRELVATMSRLGRGDGEDASPEQTDVGVLASQVVQLVERQAESAGVDLEVSVDPDTPKVLGVRSQLHQVVLNLVLNGLHATPAGGRVELRVVPAAGQAGGCCIEVQDTGAGIAPEDLERVFDPFFTTKDPDQGSGLGLMICHQLVTQHGGEIEVQSQPGEGALFRVRLPGEDYAQGV